MIIRSFCVFNFNALHPFHKQVENKVLGLNCLKHVVDNMVCGSFISDRINFWIRYYQKPYSYVNFDCRIQQNCSGMEGLMFFLR